MVVTVASTSAVRCTGSALRAAVIRIAVTGGGAGWTCTGAAAGGAGGAGASGAGGVVLVGTVTVVEPVQTSLSEPLSEPDPFCPLEAESPLPDEDDGGGPLGCTELLAAPLLSASSAGGWVEDAPPPGRPTR